MAGTRPAATPTTGRWPWLALAPLWTLAAVATAVNALYPGALVIRSSASSPVLETNAALSALLVAFLMFGRFRQSGQRLDLIVCYAVSLLAASNLLFSVGAILVPSFGSSVGARSAAVMAGCIAAFAFAGAAFSREARIDRSRRPVWELAALVVATLTILLALGQLSRLSPRAIGAFAGPLSAEAASDTRDAALTALQALTGATFLVASVRFARRSGAPGQEMLRWFALATTLWGFARINYAVTPTHLAADLTVGDWLRLGAYLALIAGAVGQIRSYWRGAAEAAVLEERRRIARELHDGLSQELAFVVTQSRSLRTRYSETRANMVAAAGERALDESRRAIAALTRPLDEPLDVALAQTSEEVAGRLGARVTLDLEAGIAVKSETREALLRIAREAVSNAGRHGEASRIVVSLTNREGVTLRVKDNGRGFDPNDLAHLSGRYGLVSMRERAQALGGDFRVQSRPFGGTEVTVWLP